MIDGIDASEITPGLAIAAAELFHEKKAQEIAVLAKAVDADLFTASSIQLILMVIDWIALSEIGDEIARAYESDDQEALSVLREKGARFSISEEGTLNSWMESPAATPIDFPLEFWTQIKFAVQAHAEQASEITGVQVDVLNFLTAGIINDGIIHLLSGENEIAIPSATKFFKEDPDKATYAVIAANAFITASVLEQAARSRTYALQETIPDSETITYEDVVSVIRDSLHDELLGR